MPVRTAPRLVTRVLVPSLFLAVAALVGCNNDEAAAPHDHTPASAKLFVNDVDVSADLLLVAGSVTRVEVRFYDDDGDEILGTELDHYAALHFTPGALGVPVILVDNHFAFDVTAQAGAGTGTAMVGWGHEASADDLGFGPFPVTVAIP